MNFYKEESRGPRALSELPTKETLRPYVGAYAGDMTEFLMSGMTMAWLRDLALHWKEQDPPGSGQIDQDIVNLLSTAGVRAESVP